MCIEDNTVLDAVIVGAGPSGSYAGWKLSEKYPQWKINVYEASNRVGGRTWSISLPGKVYYHCSVRKCQRTRCTA